MDNRRDFRRNKRPGPRGAPYPTRSPADRRADRLFIYGLHPVLAALANPRRTILRVLGTANALARLTEAGARLPSLPEEATPRDLDRLLGKEAVHQGIAIEVEPIPPYPLEELRSARLVVVLDQVTDPHNVGAILRSAAAFGVAGLIVTERHAPADTGVLAKAASGALEMVPLVRAVNLARALEQLKEAGFWLYGLDERGEVAINDLDLGGRACIVLGAEGEGLRRLTAEKCDRLVTIPTDARLAALNVSNAAAVAAYEWARRRTKSS
jgi:23S rRNA (guanosine2251-2'-O)-methyltransferase